MALKHSHFPVMSCFSPAKYKSLGTAAIVTDAVDLLYIRGSHVFLLINKLQYVQVSQQDPITPTPTIILCCRKNAITPQQFLPTTQDIYIQEMMRLKLLQP